MKQKYILFLLGIIINIGKGFSTVYIPSRYEITFSPVEDSTQEEVIEVRLNIKSLVDSSVTNVLFYSPPEIEIIQGDTGWFGILEKEEEVSFTYLLRVPNNGSYNIFARVRYLGGPSPYKDMEIVNFYILRTDTSLEYGVVPPEGFFEILDVDTTAGLGLSGPHHVQIQGRMIYYDKEINSRIPFPHAKVCLRHIPTGYLYGPAWTDINGNYNLDV